MSGRDRSSGTYPVLLNLAGRRCLVVGGGPIAYRKVEGLVAAGALVDVVAPMIVDELAGLAANSHGRVNLDYRAYQTGDVQGYWLVIASTNDPVAQQAVFDDGERLNVWVNAADDPERCSFILPAVHRREPVTIAVSTGGASPALAQWLRDLLAAALPRQLEALVARVRAERSAIRGSGRSSEGLDWKTRIDTINAELEAAPPSV